MWCNPTLPDGRNNIQIFHQAGILNSTPRLTFEEVHSFGADIPNIIFLMPSIFRLNVEGNQIVQNIISVIWAPVNSRWSADLKYGFIYAK